VPAHFRRHAEFRTKGRERLRRRHRNRRIGLRVDGDRSHGKSAQLHHAFHRSRRGRPEQRAADLETPEHRRRIQSPGAGEGARCSRSCRGPTTGFHCWPARHEAPKSTEVAPIILCAGEPLTTSGNFWSFVFFRLGSASILPEAVTPVVVGRLAGRMPANASRMLALPRDRQNEHHFILRMSLCASKGACTFASLSK